MSWFDNLKAERREMATKGRPEILNVDQARAKARLQAWEKRKSELNFSTEFMRGETDCINGVLHESQSAMSLAMKTSITQQLKEPFDPQVIHWRVGATTGDKSKGIALAYLDARDVMKRLDDICGDLWQVEYPFDGCCRIGIKIGDEWVWRSNGAGETNVEGEKGKFSDAFKRAGVLWGIGRYLYYLPNVWCELTPKGRTHVIVNPPALPKWALPSD